MNDEQVVLDFFAQEENLPLALVAAEHLDSMRLRLNNEFWQALHERLTAAIAQQVLPWDIALTEDRNSEDCTVGLHLLPHTEQALFLRPFMEQQYIGGGYRIYYGLMWSSAPTPDKAQIAQVKALREALQGDGFKDNESFLAWSWTPWHPRSKDFLMSLFTRRDELLDEAVGLIQHLLQGHDKALNAANTALREEPRSVTVSLDQLKASLKR
ncbi:MAG: hypothetical protein HY306_06590 [Nitrosomonadales bacterium]|nr:hypothetical protein [Nitrosomonadales bacterium]